MKKANPKLIGGFVVGAVVLLVVGLLAFGSGRLLEQRQPFVMFFDESLAGLNIGAPITFRGVVIGSVTDVRLDYNIETLEARVPVFAELIPGRVSISGQDHRNTIEQLEKLIDKGFRAQLVSQSFVTGQLQVQLDFLPDTEVRLSNTDMSLPEVPTVRSDLANLKDTLSELPLDRLVNSAITLLEDAQKLIASGEVKESLVSINDGLKHFRSIMGKVDRKTDPILEAAEGTLVDARNAVGTFQSNQNELERELGVTLAKVQKFLDDLDREILPISSSIQDAARSIEKTSNTVNSAIAPKSRLRSDLEVLLHNLSVASRSLRNFADEIDRNPSAIIQGRQ